MTDIYIPKEGIEAAAIVDAARQNRREPEGTGE